MECKYAVQRRGAKMFDCRILQERGEKWTACGFQRYCPQKQKTILTSGAKDCTVKNKE